MSVTRGRRWLAILLVSTAALSGCSTGPTEEQIDDARRVCIDAFKSHPEVIEHAWESEYEAVWRIGELWWEFGAGDICSGLERDMTPEEWVSHVSTPEWYVEQYTP